MCSAWRNPSMGNTNSPQRNKLRSDHQIRRDKADTQRPQLLVLLSAR